MSDHAFNLKSAFEKALTKHHDQTALQFNNEEVTYGELDRRANAVANALAEHGLGLEDRVALLMTNRVEYLVAYLGIVKAGATEVPLNPMLSHEEFRYMLSDAEARAVICDQDFIDTLATISPDLDDLHHCIVVSDDANQSLPERFERYQSIVQGQDESISPDVAPAPNHEGRHAFTGGTTGKPKGTVHTHRSRTVNLYAHIIELDLTSTDVLLLMTPLTHSAGTFATAALLAGATTIVYDEFDPETALKIIDRQSVSWTFMVPTMIYRLLDSELREEYDTSSIENIVYGAAPMMPDRLKEGIEAFDHVFTQFYGQTEVPNLITTLTKSDHRSCVERDAEERLSSAGKPCLMADVKIVDEENGGKQPPDEIGEIAVKAPYTLKEYYHRPQKTDATVEDGWVYTGDIGRRDEDGYLYLLDRKSDMIITGGMNVYSIEVEEALDKHPNVKEVAVISIPDENWGEAVKAIIVPYETANIDEADILEFADERLADYKKPKSVDFAPKLPKTPYGKIDKSTLRGRYWEGQDRQIS